MNAWPSSEPHPQPPKLCEQWQTFPSHYHSLSEWQLLGFSCREPRLPISKVNQADLPYASSPP